MPRLRIAHFSDIHYTLSPTSDLRASLEGKRAAAWASYYFGRRGQRFAHTPQRIAALLDDVDAQGVDHTICTGDLTQVSREDEFEGLARVFGARLAQPERYTLIPGNHDRYVPSARGLFERWFGALSGSFPFEKRVGAFRILALDPCRPTAVMDATGVCGDAQRAGLRDLLEADRQAPTIIALHYGLLRETGQRDRPHHCMQDAPEVQALLDASSANIALIVHGHMHRAFTVPTEKHTIVCAGSATDLHLPCGYFVYTFDEGGGVQASRRQWNAASGRYEAVESGAFNRAISERRGASFE